MIDAISAQMLLLKCTGDEIWSEEICRKEGVPQSWLDELAENYESGFDRGENMIFTDDGLTNQYRGVSDLLLARRLAELIGIDWQRATMGILDRRNQVTAIKEMLDEV